MLPGACVAWCSRQERKRKGDNTLYSNQAVLAFFGLFAHQLSDSGLVCVTDSGCEFCIPGPHGASAERFLRAALPSKGRSLLKSLR